MLTLSMCISKLYDSIFSKRFSIWLEQISFDNDQFAYRKNLSCQHAVFKLIQDSIEGFNKGHITIAVLIDLEGAFDALWHQGIIYQLHKAGLRGKALNIVWNILHSRNATIKVNNSQMDLHDLNTGACQGSSSAAVMFTFNIREMMKNVQSCKIKYSDDGNLYITGPPEQAQEMANILSQDLNNIAQWCHKWRTPINMSKTKYLILNRLNHDISINISINSIKPDSSSSNISLDRSDQERILGVIVDEKLSFVPHMDYLVSRSFSAINKIRDFSMQHLGLPTKLSLLLYITNVRSIIESSYMCWSTINEDQLNRLESVQGMMLKMIFQLKGKVSFNALNVEANILPIKLRLKQILCNFACRIMRKDHPNYFKACLQNNINRSNVGKFPTPADKIRMALRSFAKNFDLSTIEPESNISKSFECFIEPNFFIWNNLGNSKNRTKAQQVLLQQKTQAFLESLSNNDVICFTDGSVKNPNNEGIGACGAGVAIYNQGLTSDPILIPTPVSSGFISYHGELGAIKSAPNICKNIRGINIVLLSDCQSSIQSVISCKPPESFSSVINYINCTLTPFIKMTVKCQSAGLEVTVK